MDFLAFVRVLVDVLVVGSSFILLLSLTLALVNLLALVSSCVLSLLLLLFCATCLIACSTVFQEQLHCTRYKLPGNLDY